MGCERGLWFPCRSAPKEVRDKHSASSFEIFSASACEDVPRYSLNILRLYWCALAT